MPTSSAPTPSTSRVRAAAVRAALVGAVCGLAWAGALRAYMAELNSALSTVTWGGTFVGILLPGVLTGAALGAATVVEPQGPIEPQGRGRTLLRCCAAAPLVLMVIPMLLPGALVGLLTTGLGGGAVGVGLGGVAGGYAVAGRRTWARIASGLWWLVIIVGVSASVAPVGGAALSAGEPRGVWVMLLAGSLMVVLGLAASIPFRRLNENSPRRVPDRAGRRPTVDEAPRISAGP